MLDMSHARAQAVLTSIPQRRGSMLGEGLTTAAAAQELKFDEAAFDRPRRTRRRIATWLVFGALLIVGVAIVV
jgi:hypothetical protein